MVIDDDDALQAELAELAAQEQRQREEFAARKRELEAKREEAIRKAKVEAERVAAEKVTEAKREAEQVAAEEAAEAERQWEAQAKAAQVVSTEVCFTLNQN